jgi:hypothetical protein
MLHSAWLTKDFVPALRLDLLPVACSAASVGVVAFEMSFLVLILFPRTRLLAVAGGVFFHSANAYFLRISFGHLILSYALPIDWYGVCVRLGWRPDRLAALEPDAPPADPGRFRRATLIVGSLLLLVSGFCNAFDINAWPFSRYPRFERIRTESVVESLAIEVVARDGSPRPGRTGLRAGSLKRILDTRDPALRAQKLEGIYTLLGRRLELAPGDRATARPNMSFFWGGRSRSFEPRLRSTPEVGLRSPRRVVGHARGVPPSPQRPVACHFVLVAPARLEG